jgi:hypothetical protein
MSKFLILLSISIEIMMITRSLRTLYCRMLRVDVSLIKDRVVECAVRSDEKINISERVVFDSLACECLVRESFNSVSRKNSYHVLRIHDLRVDLERCSISDD